MLQHLYISNNKAFFKEVHNLQNEHVFEKVILLFNTKIFDMKNLISCLLLSSCYLFVACNTATPEDYFETAVLNMNMIAGFGGAGLQRELESPSVKLVEATKDQTVPMKRKEIIDDKVQYIEVSFQKVKQLKQTEDTKNMVQASLDLYEYVLPVYKNEYMQLAKLYDDNAPKEQIQVQEQAIYNKYFPKFSELYDNLTKEGKTYAQKNNINVNWDIHTSPQ